MSVKALKAIETRYAGCRFRSRLEARWAVFFDHLGIAWEYEAQGFEVEARLTGESEAINYLPDFWLPEAGVFAEVKGALTVDECVRLLNVAASLSEPGGGGCGAGPDTVILGPVPPPRVRRVPARLHMHKGGLQASAWDPLNPGQSSCALDFINLADDYCSYPELFQESDIHGAGARFLRRDDPLPPWELAAALTAELLLGGFRVPSKPIRVTRAYGAARSARFEHGAWG